MSRNYFHYSATLYLSARPAVCRIDGVGGVEFFLNYDAADPSLSPILLFWHSLTHPSFHPSHKILLAPSAVKHLNPSSFSARSSLTPPCFVLIASRHSGLAAALPRDRGQLWGKGNRMVKMAVWGLSATLGAAVFAVAQTAMDWGPDVLLQLFWFRSGDLHTQTHTMTTGNYRHTSALWMDKQYTDKHGRFKAHLPC